MISIFFILNKWKGEIQTIHEKFKFPFSILALLIRGNFAINEAYMIKSGINIERIDKWKFMTYRWVAGCNQDGCQGKVYLHFPPKKEIDNHNIIGRCNIEDKRHTFEYIKSKNMGKFKEMDFGNLDNIKRT